MNATGFGTRHCGICDAWIHPEDEFCSDQCEAEAERRSEEGEPAASLLAIADDLAPTTLALRRKRAS